MNDPGHIAIAANGVPIHYDVQGSGSIALVLVHGWCCNRRFWDPQIAYFSSRYTVVSIDVAGHGESGGDRTDWTVPVFAQDIVSVVKQEGLDQVVLVGHSMGGSWIIEAARHLSGSIIGVVGVDTWPNVEQPLAPAQLAEVLAPYRTDFLEAMKSFARSLFVPTSDPALIERVVTTMSAAPSVMAIDARESAMGNVRELQAGFQEVKAPKLLIYAESWRPPNTAAIQRYGIEVAPMSGVGHLVMMEDVETFNSLLDEAITRFTS